jgi:hypothetical protein
MRLKIGCFVRWDRAHGLNLDEPVWAVMRKKGRDKEKGHVVYIGEVLAGRSPKGAWDIGSACMCAAATRISKSYKWTVVPEDEIPDKEWARIAAAQLTR